jgi:hypothetical protein
MNAIVLNECLRCYEKNLTPLDFDHPVIEVKILTQVILSHFTHHPAPS